VLLTRQHSRHLTTAHRRALGLKLRKRGWSSPRIAARLQVAVGTVHRDLANFSKLKSWAFPARSVGKDGKSRPALRPAVIAKTRSETQHVLAALRTVPAEALPRKLLDVKRVERLARVYQAEQRAQRVRGDVRQGHATLLLGDMRERGTEIADASVDLLFTDLPYAEADLPLWSDLSRLAARVLKSHGMLIAYSGAMFLPEVLRRLGEGLQFWWLGSVVLVQGYHALVTARHIWHDAKPLLFYVRAGFRPAAWISDTVVSQKPEKEHHAWQQNLATAQYYIERLTKPGAVVCDPFLGGGTTGVAALHGGRQFIGIEADRVAFAGAHARLVGLSTTGRGGGR